MVGEELTLADRMRQSETDPFLLMGPEAPKAGWVYRDFYPMPLAMWLQLAQIIGRDGAEVIAVNSRQRPPAPMCRAQLWISPKAQESWAAYLRGVA